MAASSSPATSQAAAAHGVRVKLLRYAGSSVVATVCSEVAFVLLYGPLGMGTTPASLLGWLAGAFPNYWLNRSWAWGRTSRPSFRNEIVPYVTIVVLTLVLAVATTRLVDLWLHDLGTSPSVRVVLVASAFLGVYIVMFTLRFVLLDRMFARVARLEETPSTTDGAR